MKILLADDSMTAQNMARKILSDAGYDVMTVSNGAAALKKITESCPDLAILDIYMPGYTGLEVCERVKRAPLTADMPVLLSVGKLEPYREEDATRVRADGVIIKPFEATELVESVANAIRQSSAVPAREPAPSAESQRVDESFLAPSAYPSKSENPASAPQPQPEIASETSAFAAAASNMSPGTAAPVAAASIDPGARTAPESSAAPFSMQELIYSDAYMHAPAHEVAGLTSEPFEISIAPAADAGDEFADHPSLGTLSGQYEPESSPVLPQYEPALSPLEPASPSSLAERLPASLGALVSAELALTNEPVQAFETANPDLAGASESEAPPDFMASVSAGENSAEDEPVPVSWSSVLMSELRSEAEQGATPAALSDHGQSVVPPSLEQTPSPVQNAASAPTDNAGVTDEPPLTTHYTFQPWAEMPVTSANDDVPQSAIAPGMPDAPAVDVRGLESPNAESPWLAAAVTETPVHEVYSELGAPPTSVKPPQAEVPADTPLAADLQSAAPAEIIEPAPEPALEEPKTVLTEPFHATEFDTPAKPAAELPEQPAVPHDAAADVEHRSAPAIALPEVVLEDEAWLDAPVASNPISVQPPPPGDAVAPDISEDFVFQIPDLTETVAVKPPEAPFVQPAELAATSVVEPAAVPAVELATFCVPEIAAVPMAEPQEPAPLELDSLAATSIEVAPASLDEAGINAVVQRVLDRFRPQIVAEIARELANNQHD